MKRQFPTVLLLPMLVLSILSDCKSVIAPRTNQPSYSWEFDRTWDTTLSQIVLINTERSAARIFISDEYRGDSPLTVELSYKKTHHRLKEILINCDFEYFEGYDCDRTPTGRTRTNSSVGSSSYTIIVAKDGYRRMKSTVIVPMDTPLITLFLDQN